MGGYPFPCTYCGIDPWPVWAVRKAVVCAAQRLFFKDYNLVSDSVSSLSLFASLKTVPHVPLRFVGLQVTSLVNLTTTEANRNALFDAVCLPSLFFLVFSVPKSPLFRTMSNSIVMWQPRYDLVCPLAGAQHAAVDLHDPLTLTCLDAWIARRTNSSVPSVCQWQPQMFSFALNRPQNESWWPSYIETHVDPHGGQPVYFANAVDSELAVQLILNSILSFA